MSKLNFSKEAKRALLAYDFPGNVRELKAMIELACVMSTGNEISEDDLNIEKKSLLDFRDNKNNLTMRQYEMLILKDYLNKYNNNVKEVADKLDIGVATVYRMLKQEQSIFKMNGNND
jgi:DNA-binding NtrC family response regulator